MEKEIIRVLKTWNLHNPSFKYNADYDWYYIHQNALLDLERALNGLLTHKPTGQAEVCDHKGSGFNLGGWYCPKCRADSPYLRR